MTKEALREALLVLKEKRTEQQKADKKKKEYFNAPEAVSLSKSKKSADEAEKAAKKAAYDIAVGMVEAKIPLDYGVKEKKSSASETLIYDDEDATAWCLENFKDALTVNRTLLDTVLATKKNLPEFAKREATPESFTITIPTKLDDLE
jgi:hypothetical protein